MFLETRARSQGWLLPAGLTHMPSTLRPFNMWDTGNITSFHSSPREALQWIMGKTDHANLSVNRWVVGLLVLWHAQLHRTRYIQCLLKKCSSSVIMFNTTGCLFRKFRKRCNERPFGSKDKCWNNLLTCDATRSLYCQQDKKKIKMTRYMSQLSGYTSNNWSVQQCQLPLIPPGKKKRKENQSLF